MKHTYILISLVLTLLIIFPATARPENQIPGKAKVTIFWRFIPAHMNPLDIKGAFKHKGSLTASKNPSDKGAIKGKQIISLIKKKSPDKKIVRYRALLLKDGEDPSGRPTLSSITVRDDNSLYESYVIRTAGSDRALYIDVLVAR